MKLNDIKKECIVEGFPIISDEALELLSLCLKLKQPKAVLEIGTAIGYSAGAILSSCHCFLTTVEIKESSFLRAKENLTKLGLIDRSKLICVDASDYLVNLTAKFDFIFLDGPKGQYNNYLPYLLDALEKGGVLFCDNTKFHGIVDGNVIPLRRDRTIMNNMREFTENLKRNKSLTVYEFNISDGIIIAIKI
ncbi:MAG: class I SAM-dependent methyltransferase [Firmicutes bacterium]|nr:class I SAM-dependent methyltransferase [Bacillota bacterium]